MNKNILIVIYMLFILSSGIFAQDYYNATNKVDSIGRKKGIWIEYEVLPKFIEYPGKYEWFVSPLDSMKRYSFKIEDFTESNVFIWIGLYKNGLRDGKWIRYNSNRIIITEVNFNNGMLYGDYLEYYNSGKVRIRCKIDRCFLTSCSSYDEKGGLIFQRDSIGKIEFVEKFYGY